MRIKIVKKIINGAIFIIFILGADMSFALNLEVCPGTAAGRNILDYVEAFSGEEAKAGYVCLVLLDGENVGAVYIFDFKNPRAGLGAYKAFITKNSNMGAVSFITTKGFSKMAVMEMPDSAGCVIRRGSRLIYSKAKNKDIAMEAIIKARVRGEGIKKTAALALLVIVGAAIFMSIKYSSSSRLARKIKEWINPKNYFKKRQCPRINIRLEAKPGPKIKFRI